MFKSGDASGNFNGFLDAGSHIHGELRFEHEFRVDGKVTGKVTSTGDLIVGEGGEVDGDVHVGRLFVAGTVKGQVQASKQVEISPEGKVFAEIKTASLIIQDGAHFEGQCAMTKPGQAKAEGSGATSASATSSPAARKSTPKRSPA